MARSIKSCFIIGIMPQSLLAGNLVSKRKNPVYQKFPQIVENTRVYSLTDLCG